jgi:hypothetical protein
MLASNQKRYLPLVCFRSLRIFLVFYSLRLLQFPPYNIYNHRQHALTEASGAIY